QKEAFWLRVPCITLRDETEWTETIKYNWNRLVGADRNKIVEAVLNIKDGDYIDFSNEYSASKICKVLKGVV
ncbi:MAG: UDP-N-acetylglucosamine 2-epimerase, partial [Saccharolobus sp.]